MTDSTTVKAGSDDVVAVRKLGEARDGVVKELRKVIVGMEDVIDENMSWGAGPRASLNLILAGKSRAALRGRCHVAIEDIQAIALPILRHRIIPNFAARSEGMTPDSLIERLLKEVPADEKLLKKKAG